MRGERMTSAPSRLRSSETWSSRARTANASAEEGQSPYEALLSDYDFGLQTAELRRVFGALAAALPPLVAQAQARSPPRTLEVPVSAQQAAVAGTLRRLGVDPDELAGGRLGAPVHRVDRSRRLARDHALQRRRAGVAAQLAARVRPRAV